MNVRSRRSTKVDESKLCDIPVVCDVRTLIIKEAHAMKYSVRPGAETGESKMIGLEMEQETTKEVVIKKRLKEAKVSVVRVDKKGELAPRYVGPLEILERIGPVAYRLRIAR
uniref:Reverse transcriptase domain-containing protein n=1 Tax=Tanacetum cinerariifolium TaxID=118510 RepID=A0A699K9D9_TANCI|nr:reverse transcriptase domain-containing protein [Tanacetum cinerariifolium]